MKIPVAVLIAALGLAGYSLAQPPLPTLTGTPSPSPASPPPPTPSPPIALPPRVPPVSAPPPRAPTPASGPGRTPSASPSGTGSSSSTSSGSSGSGSGSGGPSEADVLTFAYNLECLEGQFYSCAAFGTPLSASITGNGPAPSSCTKANLSATVGSYAAELAREEIAHVTYLYQALTAAGGSPVCPQVNIDTAFEAAAEAAFGQSGQALTPTFNPYANDIFFLHGSFIFEDLGASAYQGGLTLLTTPDYRLAASQVGNTESYHAALGRTLLYQIKDTTPAYGKTVTEITNAIVAAINSLAGPPQIKYQLSNDQGAGVANVDSKGFVPIATPSATLKVATLGAPNGQGGGFFPSNTVGNVKN